MTRLIQASALLTLVAGHHALIFAQADAGHAARGIREALAPESATGLIAADFTIGRRLQEPAVIRLSGPAPVQEIKVTIRSSDPSRLLLSRTPDDRGAAAIVLPVDPGFRVSREFWLQGLHSEGTITYTASAAGFAPVSGTVTLARSGFVIQSRSLGGDFFTGLSAPASELRIVPALLDSGANFVRPQALACGLSAKVSLSNSNTAVGEIASANVTIEGGASAGFAQFRPISPGSTTLSIAPPVGFSTPAKFTSIVATVAAPGMSLTDGIPIGRDLQWGSLIVLSEPAPQQGVDVRITSGDSKRLIVSAAPADRGSETVTVHIPAGEFRGYYYLQALDDKGTVTYKASAPGYGVRSASIPLTPSAIVIAPPGGLDGPRGFVAKRTAAPEIAISVWTVQLDPVYHSSTDESVQPLRAGLTIPVVLQSSNSEVGGISSPVTMVGGIENAEVKFRPRSPGMTVLSVITPEGFNASANQSSLKAIVSP